MNGLTNSKNKLVIQGALELLANLSSSENFIDQNDSLILIEIIFAQRLLFDDFSINYPILTIIANLSDNSKIAEKLKSKGLLKYIENIESKNQSEFIDRIKLIRKNIIF